MVVSLLLSEAPQGTRLGGAKLDNLPRASAEYTQ